MASKIKRDVDGVTHSRPGSVDQRNEDTFPASDSPSFSPGAVGAPVNRKSTTQKSKKPEGKKPNA